MNRRKYKKKCKKEINNKTTIEEKWDRIFKRVKELFEDIDWRKIAEEHRERLYNNNSISQKNDAAAVNEEQ